MCVCVCDYKALPQTSGTSLNICRLDTVRLKTREITLFIFLVLCVNLVRILNGVYDLFVCASSFDVDFFTEFQSN